MNLAEMGIRAYLLFAVVIREQVTAYPKGKCIKLGFVCQ